jgi:hypothetical protein
MKNYNPVNFLIAYGWLRHWANQLKFKGTPPLFFCKNFLKNNFFFICFRDSLDDGLSIAV